ncbi:UNVERIFIED_CONTAM: O-antigen ligase [Acetivibrio alkalicellulosi]
MYCVDGKVKIESFVDISFCLYILMTFLSERSIVGRGTLFLFASSCIFMILIKGRLKISKYFMLEILFIAYAVFQNLYGITVDKTASSEMINTLIICTVIYISLYNYIHFRNNFRYILKLFTLSYVFSIALTLVINMGTLFTNRRMSGINIYGVSIGGISPIRGAWIAGICMILSMILYSKSNNKKFWGIFIFMTLTMFVFATRKAFLFVPLALIGNFYIKEVRFNLIKSLIYIGVTVGVLIFGYYTIMNNEILYFSVGHRLENVLNYLISSDYNTIDASMRTRIKLIETAKEVFSMRPITGWGLNNFRTVFKDGGNHVHNNFLEILVSGGWIGFIIYYAKYAYVFVALWKSRKYVTDVDKRIFNVFIVFAVILVILEYWQTTYYIRPFMMVWILILSYAKTRSVNIKGENSKSFYA